MWYAFVSVRESKVGVERGRQNYSRIRQQPAITDEQWLKWSPGCPSVRYNSLIAERLSGSEDFIFLCILHLVKYLAIFLTTLCLCTRKSRNLFLSMQEPLLFEIGSAIHAQHIIFAIHIKAFLINPHFKKPSKNKFVFQYN